MTDLPKLLTHAELAAIAERVEKATPAPWTQLPRHIGADHYHADTEIRGNPISQFGKVVGHTPVCKLHSGFIWFEGDGDFIAAAREDIPRLLADLQRYREWCRRLVETAGVVKQLSGLHGDNVYALAEEVRAALEETRDT